MPARRIGRTRWPVVAPRRLRSQERSISRSWKARTFSMATRKLSLRSGDRISVARSISVRGTRISRGFTPSKRSVYSRRAASPLSRTSSTIRRAAVRISSERNPPGRRSSPTTSWGSLALASRFLTNGLSAFLHGVREGGDLLVTQAVGAAVGDQACGGGRDLIELDKVVLPQRRARRGEVHDALGEADEGGEFYGSVQLYDLGLAAHALEVAPGGVGELGRDPDDLGVADGPTHVFGPGFGGGQDHAAFSRSKVLELYHVEPMLLEHVLPDDADVGGPVLDEDGHVGGPADNELGIPGRVDEPPPVLANDTRGKAGAF